MPLNFQIHKYKNGHQLVGSTIQLPRIDQDTIDRLSDISGQLRPGEMFEPYFTCYPLPSDKYFVVARTWQDLTAPRAGCVLTKSIVIPMREWELSDRVSLFFDALDYANFDQEFPQIDTANTPAFILGVTEAPVEEIAEALFLEQRKPIIIFDSTEAETIIKRLYTAFWPSIRKTFAACSFALSPRSITNRPFDLLFSSSNIRTRFSDWPGRRIEAASTKNRIARHHWTSELTNKLFKNDVPSLYDKSTAVFDFVHSGNESTLRLSLLWDELMSKAKFESSPIAILGLLDIVNSQKEIGGALYKNLRPFIEPAVDNALRILNPDEAWKFYAGLLIKQKRFRIDRDLLLKIITTCRSLTIANPNAAIDFISNFNPSSEQVPVILFRAIGDGLAETMPQSLPALSKINKLVGLQLLLKSRELAKQSMKLIESGREQLTDTITVYFTTANKLQLQRLKNNLLQYVRMPAHKDITSLLLKKASTEQYQRILLVIAKNTQFRFREFDDILLQSTFYYKGYQYLLKLIIDYGQEKGDKLLVSLLRAKPALIGNYYFDTTVVSPSKTSVIVEVINGLDYDALADLTKQNKYFDVLFAFLVTEKKIHRNIVAELVLLADIDVDSALAIINKLPALAINSVNIDRLIVLLNKGFAQNKVSNHISKILDKLNQENASTVVRAIFSRDVDNQLLEKIIYALLNTSGPVLKKCLSDHIDIISEQLAGSVLNPDLEESWISIFKLSKHLEKQTRAAISMLIYAYNQDKKDPANLITAAFPVVYDTLLHNRNLVQSIAYWVFPDWDKCKTLRHDLTDRYINSDWPVAGLLQVARKTGIMKEIISILGNSKDGRKYIEQIIDEREEGQLLLDKVTFKQLKKQVKK
ncbi:hypothetical protein BDD43_2327 [Mucilaginibacter gracilis]|uniref:Uncharacterized protein n=1 Tax=Mucilaginibacter gracilis TaxID=423350 RepID=A0A495J1E8_9SPHI|nr:hypothetical protein [Mucilaginibacter gracilis]RKR82158.1 hypothetical protein BDD43_2327 [Mucilaginibacter gracilis]